MLATILPNLWFTDQHWALLLGVATVCIVFIIYGADWLVRAAAELASRLGMPQIVIGATIVSLGTTTPEMSVSVLAAWTGNSGLALGNAVGSIIADTGLIFGLGCIMAGTIKADGFILSRQGWVQVGVAFLLAAVCYTVFVIDGEAATLSRWFGIVLLVLLAVYLVVSVKWSRQQHKAHKAAELHEPITTEPSEDASRGVLMLLLLGAAGLLCVVIPGDALVQSMTEVALQWEVPQAVIAATLVALGTSLPELVVGLTAVRKGHPELLVGNVIGADVLNVLFVIGAAALAAPLPIIGNSDHVLLYLHLPVMLLVLVLFRVFIMRAKSVGHFSAWMGWPLIVIYGLYIAFQVQYLL